MKRKTWKNNVHFVLVGPTESGNIGAAARAIKNMDFHRLELVGPVPHLTDEARSMACHAKDVLEAAQVHKTLRRAVAGKALAVGTTRRPGGRRGLIVDVRTGAPRIRKAAAANPVAVLFGNEHTGLTNMELDQCGLVLTIPSSVAFPSLNLAQSVLILAYELSRLEAETRTPGLVAKSECEKLYRRIPGTLQILGYGRKGDKDLNADIARNLRRLIGRAGLTEWELNMLLGLCTRIERKLRRKK
ncbi:MAG: RNA methyltransferase [Candidatus Aminicenantes bacterium]|nr:RNA methyltransferase [Candidatus Aminicenantes bacterium]